ncbi:NAD(P)/FAD-dependent oxidoreductase [Clostridium estertheticum]|uniref:NAD(P)/FAD-dependent oxidoreductase n=1 Tax=Clostridium estertheticum TaxID=238834 RepID=UPI001C7DD1A9|nr:FAD-dependent oxidoreductase [Clostridium estertheticum]MBX4269107.1 FAD-dependent oxidoreductase [Clostridium estertheticum]WLC80518.1 FAD-dependent oxidoreductase [Clostridium estertheticum]
MTIRVNNITLDIDESIDDLRIKAAKLMRVSDSEIKKIKIAKESIDARKKNNIKFNYAVNITMDNEINVVTRANNKDVKLEEDKYEAEFEFGTKKMNHRPIIVGMGPAGMFAGILMAQKGYKPLIIERGEKVENRTKTINKFWTRAVLNTESNVQFGEGGAGTFSDGKLTTRIKDTRCDYILEEFVKAGAPEEIVYIGKPHIGTDVLKDVVKNIRETIIKLGGEVRFNSKLEDIKIKDGKMQSIIVNGEEIPCDNLILAPGHSSRDTYEMLYKNGVSMSSKPFAVGVRIEHPQDMINENQYGKYASHPRLKAADYKLTYKSSKLGRAVYSFCMCPGGAVVSAASEQGKLVINGMSEYNRDKKNANSAIVVSVGPKDFASDNPLAGIEFQRYYEGLAYKIGGENYNAPVQLVGDFLKGNVSDKIGSIKPSYTPGYKLADLTNCLPTYVTDAIKEALPNFEHKINGFSRNDAILTGIETRTSAPVRIDRNEEFQSISLEGLYPAGEGAGYAGGIISAAVDGLKIAESIMKKWKCV